MNKYDEEKLKEYGNAKLWYLIGLPRSGKSTLAREWASQKPNRIILSRDPFRYSVYGSFWDKEREMEMKKVFYNAVDAIMMNGDLEIMIDDTNVAPRSRKEWVGRGGIGVLVNTQLEECLARVPDEEGLEAFKESIKKMEEILESEDLPINTVIAEDFFK